MTTSTQTRHHQEAIRAERVHRPALDGIRALAIVLVMLYHASGLTGGFFGVDVFFVLSGYLITGLLVNEWRKWGGIDFASFYRRRARRLFPALILVLLLVTVIGPRILDQYARATMRGDGVATAFYYANWHFIATGQSYFAQTGDPSPYRQMWSLAIEEQFYLVLPAAILAGLALLRGNCRRLAVALFALACLSALWMAHLYVPGADPSRVYYGSDTRAQDLLVGAALACWLSAVGRRRVRRYASLVSTGSVIGCAVILAMATTVAYTSNLAYTGGFLLLSVATCAVILAVEALPDSLLARCLGLRWWAWIGRISYGLYLWHWPIFVMISPAHVHAPSAVIFALRFVLTFAASAASYYLLEQPIRLHGIKRYVGRSLAVLIGAVALPVTGVTVAVASPSPDNALLDAQAGQQQSISAGAANATLKVLLEGDSVAFGLGTDFPAAQHAGVEVDGHPVPGCGLATQWIVVDGSPQGSSPTAGCDTQLNSWRADETTYKPDVVLLVEAGWDILDHKIDGKVLDETSPQYAAYELKQLDAALRAFGPTTKLVIPNIPCLDNSSSNPAFEGIAKVRNDPKRWAALNAIFEAFAGQHPGRVTVFDLASKICPGGKYTNTVHGVAGVRMDGLHFT